MVTVHDVAARSGVSIATVSRTIRAPHRVSTDTRDRVLVAIRELGYRPNRAAISLRRGRTGVIALVVPDIENPYFASLTKGAQTMARGRGYGLVVVDTAEQADVEGEEIRALAPQVDGVVLASSRLSDDTLAELATTTMCVLINRSLPGHASDTPSVTIDERAAGRAALGHLYDLGHRRVTYVGGPARSWSQARRSDGIREAASELDGVEVTEVSGFTPDSSGGRTAAAAALENQPTAVIAYNDLVALGLLAKWSEMGIRVPGDMSLMGFDNTYVAELSSPSLTSIGADLRVLGERAIELLIERLDPPVPSDGPGENAGADADADRAKLAPRLAIRSSTTTPRTAALPGLAQ